MWHDFAEPGRALLRRTGRKYRTLKALVKLKLESVLRANEHEVAPDAHLYARQGAIVRAQFVHRTAHLFVV
jgi:hypothetical protein